MCFEVSEMQTANRVWCLFWNFTF